MQVFNNFNKILPKVTPIQPQVVGNKIHKDQQAKVVIF